MALVHQLLMPAAVLYGEGSFAEIGGQAKKYGKKALIVSDPIMEQIGNVELCVEHLRNEGLAIATYTGVDSEPTDIHVKEALSLFQTESCDVIVAIGGGSCIDTAKAVAALATNGGSMSDYMGNKKLFTESPIPLLAVPTTAGTGSEVTKVTVITDTVQDIKMMVSQPALLPAVAIVDPQLTVSCPPSVTAATGVDALCHAIEAYISRRSQPVTDTLALSAIELIVTHLRRAYENGNDIEARDKVALGSMLAGVAFSNASVTLVHGMSRPIGALFHVPHGVSNAMLLPAVLEFTKDSAAERLAAIGRLIRPEAASLSNEELAEMVIAELKQLCLDLKIPNMKTWGIEEEKFEMLVSKMAVDAIASGSPGNNPRVPSEEEIIQLYHTCYDYQFAVEEKIASET
nr:iron-containing alcohol dehydrogenase [Aneurinibacillus tyrosinisolvens]